MSSTRNLLARRLTAATTACAALLCAGNAAAFNYGEHYDIAVTAARALSTSDREALAGVWSKLDGPDRTCRTVDDSLAADRLTPSCIAFADLSALAADHACSVEELKRDVKTYDWTLKVVGRAMQTRRDLARGHGWSGFVQGWRRSDLDLELLDAQYGSRAASNDAHFALPRASDGLSTYLYEALEIDGPPLNAVGLYAIFHTAALRLATAAGAEPDGGGALRERAVLTEAFALHFLEDMFSSGHIVGTIGDIATKKGTHDEYSIRGLDVRTWRGASYEAHGDAHLTADDLAHASAAVTASLAQLAGALRGDEETASRVSEMPLARAQEVAALDVCRATKMPPPAVPRAMWPSLQRVLDDSPMPARLTTLLPRTRAEIGVFFGAWAGARGTTSTGDGPTYGDLELSLRSGVNLQDVVGPMADGQFMLEAGVLVGTELLNIPDFDPRSVSGATRGIPHQGLKLSIRAPFFLLPGDLLAASPFLLLLSPRTLEVMALAAAYGGFIPWQRPIPTPAGVVQFVLGRKIDAYLFGERTFEVFLPGVASPEVVAFRSWGLGFPIVEWSPLRRYGARDAFGFKVQIGGAIEVPYGLRDVTRGLDLPGLSAFPQGFVSIGLWGHRYL